MRTECEKLYQHIQFICNFLTFTHNFLSMPKSTMNIYVNNNNNFFLKHSSMNKDNKDWVPTFTTHLTKLYLLMAFKSFDRSNLIGL